VSHFSKAIEIRIVQRWEAHNVISSPTSIFQATVLINQPQGDVMCSVFEIYFPGCWLRISFQIKNKMTVHKITEFYPFDRYANLRDFVLFWICMQLFYYYFLQMLSIQKTFVIYAKTFSVVNCYYCCAKLLIIVIIPNIWNFSVIVSFILK
jgi:hypothetical protein